MQLKHTFRSRILSFILCLVMAFSLLPINGVFAIDDINKGDGTGGDGTDSSYPNRGVGEEGLRVTLFWVPLKGGQPDWSSRDNIVQIGTTLDLRSTEFEKLNYGIPTIYGDFTDAKNSAKEYRMDGNNKFNANSGSAYNQKTIPNLVPGKTHAEYEKNAGKATLQFPILFTSKENSTDPLDYFRHWSVRNEIMFSIQEAKWGSRENAPYWVEAGDLETGMRPTDMGARKPGQYIMIVENIIFFKSDGIPAVVTLREAIRLADTGSSILGDMATPITNMANSLYLTKDWSMLNLWGATGINGEGNNGATNQIPAKSIKANKILADQKLGVGIIEFTAAKQVGIPIVNYYYNLKESEVEWALDPDGNQVAVSAKLEAFDRKADNAEPLPSSADYIATPKFTPVNNPEAGEYTLIKGYIANTDVNKGYLDSKKDFPNLGLTFWENGQLAKLSEAVKTRTGLTEVTQVKQWNDSQKLETSDAITRSVSKLAAGTAHLTTTPENGIKVNFGEGIEKMQAVFLYVRLPDSSPSGTPFSGGFPLYPTPDDPDITEKRILPPTNVTKMYIDVDPVTKEEKVVKTTTEVINKESTYTIPSKDGEYTMKEWTLVDDKTPSVPEPYPDWSTVTSNTSSAGKSGTTAGDLGPANWNEPDRELFIKFVKEPKAPEVIDSQLYLPERRISWHKSLIDINGGTVPTITFSWAAITGTETHYDGCGSEDSPCPGHPCNESIGSDNFFRFVSTNLTAVKSDIMGNKTNFMPYDKDNVHH